MKRSLIALIALAAPLGACKGFKEAMTAHVDVAAKAGTQELSTERLASLLSRSRAPVTPEIARGLTDLWVNYQLLGQAAARGDSLTDPKLVDDALWPIIAQERMGKWHEQLSKGYTGLDTTNLEARYDKGELLAARHILIAVPQNATPAQRDEARKHAETVRAQVTPANFAEVAKKESQDPGSAPRGGDLGLFPKGAMVKEFDSAVAALKPGQISSLVQTQFGYHIIQRSPYADVKDEFARAVNAEALRAADSTYIARLVENGDVKVKDNAVSTMRNAAKDLDAHAKDGAVLATSKAGNFTLGRLVRWIDADPRRAQIEQGLQQAPDSQVVGFLKSLVRNELLLRQADSAKVQLDPADLAELRSRFAQVVAGTWDELGVSPKALADSGSTPAQRERIAAARIDQYMDKLMAQEARYVDVAQPVATVLRAKYGFKVNAAGLERAVERGTKERAAADSAAEASRPKSEVPLAPPAGEKKP
jgi:peptidyl-prolyl cis-trans isomerase D